MNQILMIYFVVINIVAFVLYGVDKQKAIKHQWRIPEKTLFLVAILGGTLGAIFGMQFFRHKTKHWSFKLGLPMILLIQVLGYHFFMR
ncbi:MAG: DUF1294 domain-containing protein [Eubacteriales bacterium]